MANTWPKILLKGQLLVSNIPPTEESIPSEERKTNGCVPSDSKMSLSSKTLVLDNGQKNCNSSASVWEVTFQSYSESTKGLSLIVPITVGDKPALL